MAKTFETLAGCMAKANAVKGLSLEYLHRVWKECGKTGGKTTQKYEYRRIDHADCSVLKRAERKNGDYFREDYITVYLIAPIAAE